MEAKIIKITQFSDKDCQIFRTFKLQHEWDFFWLSELTFKNYPGLFTISADAISFKEPFNHYFLFEKRENQKGAFVVILPKPANQDTIEIDAKLFDKVGEIDERATKAGQDINIAGTENGIFKDKEINPSGENSKDFNNVKAEDKPGYAISENMPPIVNEDVSLNYGVKEKFGNSDFSEPDIESEDDILEALMSGAKEIKEFSKEAFEKRFGRKVDNDANLSLPNPQEDNVPTRISDTFGDKENIDDLNDPDNLLNNIDAKLASGEARLFRAGSPELKKLLEKLGCGQHVENKDTTVSTDNNKINKPEDDVPFKISDTSDKKIAFINSLIKTSNKKGTTEKTKDRLMRLVEKELGKVGTVEEEILKEVREIKNTILNISTDDEEVNKQNNDEPKIQPIKKELFSHNPKNTTEFLRWFKFKDESGFKELVHDFDLDTFSPQMILERVKTHPNFISEFLGKRVVGFKPIHKFATKSTVALIKLFETEGLKHFQETGEHPFEHNQKYTEVAKAFKKNYRYGGGKEATNLRDQIIKIVSQEKYKSSVLVENLHFLPDQRAFDLNAVIFTWTTSIGHGIKYIFEGIKDHGNLDGKSYAVEDKIGRAHV